LPEPVDHPIWPFQERLAKRLLTWALLSMGLGAALLTGDAFRRGFGVQAVAWGAIDALLALSARRGARRRAPEAGPDESTKAARNLRRLLWFNTGLDVLYVAGGGWLVRTKGRTDPNWRGQGWGIIVQGAFLFVFDLVHALRTPGPMRE
jgi:hypothetical protein